GFARRFPAGSSVDVLLRLNPDVAPETHDSLAVARGASKFGLTETDLTEAADTFAGAPGLRLRGIHLHVGSQLGAVDAWRDGVRRARARGAPARSRRVDIDTPGRRRRGIHPHVGSQLGAVDAWRDGVRRALALVALVRGGLDDFDTLDVGGGFPGQSLTATATHPHRVSPHGRAL